MNNINTTPEKFDDENIREPEAKDILMNEDAILSGLLDLANSKDNKEFYQKIDIRRGGVLKITFRVRPLSSDEIESCRRSATKYAPCKKGEPKKEIDCSNSLFQSYLIYTATIGEDRAKIWDNTKAQEKLNVMFGVDMVDKVLLAGEKSRVIDIIMDNSGFGDEEDTAKN